MPGRDLVAAGVEVSRLHKDCTQSTSFFYLSGLEDREMRVTFLMRGVLAVAVALSAFTVAGCTEQPALTPDQASPQQESRVFVAPEAGTTSSTTSDSTGTGRGPGTVGSGH